MYKTFLSWRYLRARRTNLIGITGIFVGVGALILILSIMAGFLDQSRQMIRGSLADIVVQPRFFDEAAPQSAEPLLELVRADPGVEHACAQLVWYGIIAREGRIQRFRMQDVESSGLSMVELVGIDPADELDTTGLREALEQTRPGFKVSDPDLPFAPPPGFRPLGRPRASVVIGEQLAAVWYLSRNDIIEIMTVVPDPETGQMVQNNRQFVVAGTFRTGENEIDLHRVYVDRRELQDFLGDRNDFSQLLVKVHDYAAEGEVVRDRLRDELAEAGLITGRSGAEVRTWEEFRQVLLGAIENEKTLMAIMLSLVLVVAGFTVFAILSMMVTEKRRDIGILTALGATPRGVMWMFLLIGFWDALLGATLGAVAGVWAALKIDPIERALSSAFGVEIFRRDVYLFDHIPSVVDPLGVAVIVLGAFACTLLFALFPAWKAARLDPVDALRYE
jgi:lipoprotein-releasing system permease protein